MKRYLASTLVLGAIASFGLVGCADETKVESTEKISTPSGTQEKVITEKVKTTGDGAAGAPVVPK